MYVCTLELFKVSANLNRKKNKSDNSYFTFQEDNFRETNPLIGNNLNIGPVDDQKLSSIDFQYHYRKMKKSTDSNR